MAKEKSRKAGVLWINTTKEGKYYYTIVLEGKNGKRFKYVAFKNSYKEEDTQPDYIVYYSKQKGN